MGPKVKRNEIELSFLHYSIRLDELIILVFGFWAQNFLEALIKNPRTKLFAKSIFTSIMKVSDKFIEKCRSMDFGD